MSNEQVGTVLTWEDAQMLERGDLLNFASPMAPFGLVDYDQILLAKMCRADDGAEWVYVRLRGSLMRLLILERGGTLVVVACCNITGFDSHPDLGEFDQPFILDDFEGWEIPRSLREQCRGIEFKPLVRHDVSIGANTLDWAHYGGKSLEPGGTDFRLYQYNLLGRGQVETTLLGRIMPTGSEVRVIKKEAEETII